MMTQFLPGQPVAADCVLSGDCNAVVTSYHTEMLVFVPLHLELDIVTNGPIYTAGVPTNTVLDMVLSSDPPPSSG